MADLVVGRHPAERAGAVTADDKVLVLQTFDQRIDGRLADRDQRRARRLAHDLRGVAEQLDERRNRLRVADFSERLGRRAFHRPVAVATGDDQRVHGLRVLEFAAGLGRMLAHAPPLVLQAGDEPVHDPATQMRHRRHRLVAYFHDRIVEQRDERLDGLRPADSGDRPARVRADRPKVVADRIEQRLERGRVGLFGERFRGFFPRRVVNVFERFQQIVNGLRHGHSLLARRAGRAPLRLAQGPE